MKRSGTVRRAAFALIVAACVHNAPVTSPPNQQDATRKLPQAETSLLRIDHTENGSPVSRFMVTFNDDTNTAIPDGISWQYDPNGLKSTSGWATSPNGKTWTRRTQIVASQALKNAGLNALHGDPWIAGWNSKDPNSPSVALYSIGQTGLARFGPPWYLAVARSMDSGVTFQDPVIVLGPQPSLPDGPKVAVTGDGNFAIVAWHGPGIQYKVLSNVRNNGGMTIPPDNGGVHDVLPATIATPPNNCGASPILHPQVAATVHTFYLTLRVAYCQLVHFEVYRADAAALAAGGSFVRVLSVTDPIGESDLAAQNLQAGTFAHDFDRGGLGMSLAAGADQFGDYVLLVAQRTATVQGENSHNEIVQFRLGSADTCDAANHKGDLDSCGAIDMQPQPIEGQPRLGMYELKPQAFVGKVPDGAFIDQRVGIVWYTQPYRGQQGNITDEMRTRTGIEAVVSTDAGKTWSAPLRLVSKDNGPGPATDPNIGDYFNPCQFKGDPDGYFGEYIGGAFLDYYSNAVVATWADSRESCFSQSSPGTFHMHVWAGWSDAEKPKNGCGGNAQLPHPPGLPCVENGQCGKWSCAGDSAVICDTNKSVKNECGGCNPLPIGGSGHGKGDFCICNNPALEEGYLVCGPTKNKLICCPCSSAPGCGPGSP